MVSLLDGYAIPQNWLVDPDGMWRWKQLSYGGGSDADFKKKCWLGWNQRRLVS